MAEIVVIGDIILDVNYNGTATRLAQEACVPVVNIIKKEVTSLLGGAANVYHNLLSVGLDAKLISVGGKDNEYYNFCDILESTRNKFNKKDNLSENCIIIDPSRSTTVKHRFYVNNKMVFRYDSETNEDISQNTEQMIIEEFNKKIDVCKIVILSDYNKGVLTPTLTQEIIRISNTRKIKVFIDPKLKDVLKYSDCYLIKPNKNEGEHMCGHKITKDNLENSMKEIMIKMRCIVCLLTMGEEGIAILSTNEGFHYFPINQSHVIDITGAGDVVLASFVYNYLRTYNLVCSCLFANYCGQLKVKNLGTYALTKYDLLVYESTYKNKLIERKDLEDNIELMKGAGKKIVFTNGCFDILHYGHLTLLEEAKINGDILIVALNTDVSIKENKGNERPINKLEYRIKQISALSYVDFIVVFEEKTPYEILSIIRPDVLIKGGDYKIETIVGKNFAKETKILKYNDGFSTTGIIEKMKK